MTDTTPSADELREMTPSLEMIEASESRAKRGQDEAIWVGHQTLRIALAVAGNLDRIATALEEEAAIADAALEQRPAGSNDELRDRLVGAIQQARAERLATVTLCMADAALIEIALGRAAP